MDKIFERKIYTDKIKGFIGKEVIKIITGIRRCGKSEILKLIKNEILKTVDKEHIVFINFESIEFDFIKNYTDLHKYVAGKMLDGKKYYLFFDEIQGIIRDAIDGFDDIYWDWAHIANWTDAYDYQELLKDFAYEMIEFSYEENYDFMREADKTILDALKDELDNAIDSLIALSMFEYQGNSLIVTNINSLQSLIAEDINIVNKGDFFSQIKDLIDDTIYGFAAIYSNWFKVIEADYRQARKAELDAAYNEKADKMNNSNTYLSQMYDAYHVALEKIEKTEFTDWLVFGSVLHDAVANAQMDFEHIYIKWEESQKPDLLILLAIPAAILMIAMAVIIVYLIKKNRSYSNIMYEGTDDKYDKRNKHVNERAEMILRETELQREKAQIVAQAQREKAQMINMARMIQEEKTRMAAQQSELIRLKNENDQIKTQVLQEQTAQKTSDKKKKEK